MRGRCPLNSVCGLHARGLILPDETTGHDGLAGTVNHVVSRPGAHRDRPVGADKGYDTAKFVAALERRGIKAHVARKVSGSAVDGRTARGRGYAMSLRRRKMIEEAFGWIKTVGGLRKTRHKGLEKLSGQALFAFAAYNLTRLLNLMRPAAT
jgi:IS5 family transposase